MGVGGMGWGWGMGGLGGRAWGRPIFCTVFCGIRLSEC